MVVYWSIVAWAFLVSSFIEKHNKQKMLLMNKSQENNSKYTLLSVFAVFFLMWFFAGFRTNYVGDTALYVEGFQKVQPGFRIPKYSSSFLFDFLRIIVKTYFTDSVIVWLFLLDTLAMIPLCYAIAKYSIDLRVSVAFFIFSGCFEYFFNGARQIIAVAICFYATRYLEKNKIIKYILFIAIASLIHGSAIIMLAGVLLYRIKPWSKITALMILVTIVFLIMPKSVLSTIISDTVEGTDYALYKNQLLTEGLNPIRAVTLLVPTVLSFIYKDRIKEINNPILNYSVNTALVTSILYTLGLFINGLIAARVAMYFMVFNMILYPYLLNVIIPKNNKTFKIIFYVAYLVYFIYQMYFSYGGLPYVSDVLGIYLYK